MKISGNKSNYIFSGKKPGTPQKDLFDSLDTVQLNSQLEVTDEEKQLEKLRSMAKNTVSVCNIKDYGKRELSSSPLFMAIIGSPGAGKGTQGKRLAEKYNIPHISAGKLLREIAKKDTPLARDVKDCMGKGELVPDKLIANIIAERLHKADCKKGFILDGFPRTAESAELLDELLAKDGKTLGNVIELKTSREECLKRLMARGRQDDKADVINHRYDIYLEESSELKEHFKGKKDLYKEFSSEGPVDTMQNKLVDLLEKQLEG